MRETLSRAFEPTAAVILVTGAGGAFKQVLVDTGAGKDIAQYFINAGLTPVLLAFAMALLLRVVQGSATVAMITAAGLIAPLISVIAPNPWQLAVLTTAIAAGATGFSHVNDSGFWLVGRLFKLTEAETLKSWTLLTGVISLTGLLVCFCLYGALG
jgi:H+/gluconate symporter-like permease